MKTQILSVALLLISTSAWCQVGELHNADVIEKTAMTNPAEAAGTVDGDWLAFSLPVLEGTRSPCCWKGRWNGYGNGHGAGQSEVGCSLESSHQSFGTRSDSPLTENVIVLGRIRNGQAQDIRVVGESCPVDGGGQRVTWIGEVGEKAGLDWLEDTARQDSDNTALYALALHRSSLAGERLYSLAKDGDEELSEQAIFWLGDARAKEGFKRLESLLAELPVGDTRRQINFALSQNGTPEAAELLFEISRSDPDPEQRGEAMFWLAQEYPQRARGWLLEVIKTEKDEDVLEQAVFAISELPDGAGDSALLDLAKDENAPRAVRRQALFWLANSDDDSSVAALTELLTR